jgi:hypothetical protein
MCIGGKRMFNKRKLNFWRLAFIFTGLIIITLFFLWSSPNKPKSQMMGSSMGNNMASMKLSNATIYDLFNSESQMSQQMNDMSSHHNGQSASMVRISFLTTSVIFFLIPLIIGGTIILAIVWIK